MMPQNLPVVCAICGRLLRKRRDALGAPATVQGPLDRSGRARFQSDPDRRDVSLGFGGPVGRVAASALGGQRVTLGGFSSFQKL
jgi:hypothetical protein